MNQKSNISLFTESGCLTIEAMKKLQSSTLDPTDKDIALKHLLGCELCNDAYEGLKLVGDPEKLNEIITEINDNLNKNLITSENTLGRKPVNRHIKQIGLSAAASIIILIGLFFLLKTNQDKSLSENIKELQNFEFVPTIPLPDTDAVHQQNSKKTTHSFSEDSLQIQKYSTQNELKEEIDSDNDTEIFLADDFDSQEFFLEAIVVSTRQTLNQHANTKSISEDPADAENSQIERVGEIDEEAIITEETESIYTVVEEMPEFPQGYEKLSKFLRSNLKYPLTARENGIEGKIFVSFIVEENGNISKVNILRGIGGGCDEEAKRVIESMPDWIPGKQRGKAVKVQFNMPIVFRLN